LLSGAGIDDFFAFFKAYRAIATGSVADFK